MKANLFELGVRSGNYQVFVYELQSTVCNHAEQIKLQIKVSFHCWLAQQLVSFAITRSLHFVAVLNGIFC